MIQERKTIDCIRPKNLDIELLIKRYPPTFTYKKDGFLYLIDIWFDQYGWRKYYGNEKDDGYVPLHSQVLKSVLYDYQKYLDYLVRVEVFLVNSSYQTGVRSKSYRLNDSFQTETVQDSITDIKLIGKINKKKQLEYESVVDQYKPLMKWFDGLEIDIEGATNFINEYVKANTKPKMKKRAKQKLFLKKACYTQMITRIHNKDYTFKLDRKSGRLYTLLTNLKKEFRKFLTYEGEKLVCIDLSNAQPFLATLLLNEEFYTKTGSYISLLNVNSLTQRNKVKMLTVQQSVLNFLKGYNRGFTPVYMGYKKNNQREGKPLPLWSPSLPMCGKLSIIDDTNDLLDEWTLYKSIVGKGEFYKYIGEQIANLNNECTVVINPKQLVITVLFSENGDERPFFKVNKRLFKFIFPNINELFKIVKSDDHTFLAVLLQNIESEIFLNRIGNEITLKKPFIPFFTIHDSICVPLKYEIKIKSLITAVIEKAVGIKPHLKTEHWF